MALKPDSTPNSTCFMVPTTSNLIDPHVLPKASECHLVITQKLGDKFSKAYVRVFAELAQKRNTSDARISVQDARLFQPHARRISRCPTWTLLGMSALS